MTHRAKRNSPAVADVAHPCSGVNNGETPTTQRDVPLADRGRGEVPVAIMENEMTEKAPERITQLVHEAMTDALRDYDIADEVWRNDPEFGQAIKVTSDAIWEFATRQQAEAVGAVIAQAADIVACQCQCKPVTLDKAIRALTPSDATAALEARDARVWSEAIEAVGLKLNHLRQDAAEAEDWGGCSAYEEAEAVILKMKKVTPDAP